MRFADSCGYAISALKQFVGERSQPTAWCKRKGPAGIADYQPKKNC